MDSAFRITCFQHSDDPTFDFDPDGAVLTYLEEYYPYFEVPQEGHILYLDIAELEQTFEQYSPPPEVREVFARDIEQAKAAGASDISYIRL